MEDKSGCPYIQVLLREYGETLNDVVRNSSAVASLHRGSDYAFLPTTETNVIPTASGT